jgi:hypothetical protein
MPWNSLAQNKRFVDEDKKYHGIIANKSHTPVMIIRIPLNNNQQITNFRDGAKNIIQNSRAMTDYEKNHCINTSKSMAE